MTQTIVKELLVRYLGDTKGLDEAGKKAEQTISNVEQKAQKSAFNITKVLRGVGIAATAMALAYTAVGLTNEKARRAANEMSTEFNRLIGDIDEAIHAGENLKVVFDNITTSITIARATLRTLTSETSAFVQKNQRAFDILFRRNKGKIDLAENIDFGDANKESKTYQQHLEDIYDENIKIELQEQVAGKKRSERNTASNDALRTQRELMREQQRAWEEANRAIEEQKRKMRELKTEAAGYFSDIIEGTSSFRDVAINALNQIARSLLSLSIGGNSGGGLFGSVAEGIFGGIGGLFGGGGFNPATSAPPRKPSFNTGGSFTIKGASGIDRNSLSLNGQQIANVSKGETVSIGTGGGGSGTMIEQNINFYGDPNGSFEQNMQRFLPQLKEISVEAVQQATYRGKLAS